MSEITLVRSLAPKLSLLRVVAEEVDTLRGLAAVGLGIAALPSRSLPRHRGFCLIRIGDRPTVPAW